MDTTILRSNLNSARMTCGLAQRPEYRDLMTAASKLTGERVNRSTHNHSVRGRGAVCAGVNYCGNPGCDLVFTVVTELGAAHSPCQSTIGDTLIR